MQRSTQDKHRQAVTNRHRVGTEWAMSGHRVGTEWALTVLQLVR